MAPRTSRSSPDYTVRDVIGIVLAREVRNIERFDAVARVGVDPEGVHQLRVSARRLRSELRVVASAFTPVGLGVLEPELRWLGRALGPLRDAEVLAGMLTGRVLGDSELDHLLQRALSSRYEQGRRNALRLLRSQRYRRLRRLLTRTVASPPLRDRADEPAVHVLLPRLRRSLEDYFSMIATVGASPSYEQLHQIRIATKRCRYNCEVAVLYLGSPAGAVAGAFEGAQTVLGDLHDRVVALDFVHDVAPASDALDVVVSSIALEIEDLAQAWRPFVQAAHEASGALWLEK